MEPESANWAHKQCRTEPAVLVVSYLFEWSRGEGNLSWKEKRRESVQNSVVKLELGHDFTPLDLPRLLQELSPPW